MNPIITLLQLADQLDSKGLYREADLIDTIIIQAADNPIANIAWATLRKLFLDSMQDSNPNQAIQKLIELTNIKDPAALRLLINSLSYKTIQEYQNTLDKETRNIWRSVVLDIANSPKLKTSF